MDQRAVDTIKALEGHRLWDRTRAAGLEMFQFGDRVETQDFRGNHNTVGEWALHLTGAWRITANGRVLVGYNDYRIPAEGASYGGFNPSVTGASRRDELMELFVAHGEDSHLVERAFLGDLGDLRLVFADGCVLEAFSDIGFVEPIGDEAPEESWLLLQPAADAPHLVSEAGGVVVYYPG